jgi:hypothetical protein
MAVEKIGEKYRFAGFVAVNTVIAFYFVELMVPWLMRVTARFFVPYSYFGDPAVAKRVVLLRCINTAICGFVAGMVASRLLRSSSGRWVWVPSILWFLFGMASYAAEPTQSVMIREGVLRHFFSFGPDSLSSWESIRDYSRYALPTISGLAYSLGALCVKVSDEPVIAAKAPNETVGA